MGLAPNCDQVIAALADVFGLDDVAPKGAWRAQGTSDLDLNVAVPIYAGPADGDAGVDIEARVGVSVTSGGRVTVGVGIGQDAAVGMSATPGSRIAKGVTVET